MKKILVISDIHYPTRLKNIKILDNLIELMKDFDITVGCGDYVNLSVVELIRNQVKNCYLVKGNMDFFDDLPQKLIVELQNYKVGIIHGDGSPFGIERRILKNFENKPDLILFGHTHCKEDKIIENIRMINPGALCDGNFCKINIYDNEIDVEFCKI